MPEEMMKVHAILRWELYFLDGDWNRATDALRCACRECNVRMELNDCPCIPIGAETEEQFEDFKHALTRNGLVVLRHDDRSPSNFMSSSVLFE